mmetsp:Transcript_25248/g.99680  ORF Transcript_25248/g.99680 Transcript_25248/m.99680 type:complete len:181 (+) Transcript_25248:143-685(+)
MQRYIQWGGLSCFRMASLTSVFRSKPRWFPLICDRHEHSLVGSVLDLSPSERSARLFACFVLCVLRVTTALREAAELEGQTILLFMKKNSLNTGTLRNLNTFHDSTSLVCLSLYIFFWLVLHLRDRHLPEVLKNDADLESSSLSNHFQNHGLTDLLSVKMSKYIYDSISFVSVQLYYDIS